MSEKPPRPTSPIISNPSSLKSSLSNWNGASPPVLDGPNTRNRLSQTITNYSNLNGNPPPFGYTRSHQYSNSVGGESNLGNRDGDQDLKMSLKEWKEWDGSYGNGRSSLNSSNGRYVEPPRFQVSFGKVSNLVTENLRSENIEMWLLMITFLIRNLIIPLLDIINLTWRL